MSSSKFKLMRVDSPGKPGAGPSPVETTAFKIERALVELLLSKGYSLDMNKRIFNVAGPCIPGKHYMLEAQERCHELMELIDGEQFFVLHAARQTGKTTLLNNLEQELNAGDRYHALYCSLESVQSFPEAERGIPAVVRAIRQAIDYHPVLAEFGFAREHSLEDLNTVVCQGFVDLARALNRPLHSVSQWLDSI